jgi:hypothetical protein
MEGRSLGEREKKKQQELKERETVTRKKTPTHTPRDGERETQKRYSLSSNTKLAPYLVTLAYARVLVRRILGVCIHYLSLSPYLTIPVQTYECTIWKDSKLGYVEPFSVRIAAPALNICMVHAS